MGTAVPQITIINYGQNAKKTIKALENKQEQAEWSVGVGLLILGSR